MDFYTETVTIWNKYENSLWGTEVWIPTVLENARLLLSRGNNIQNSGNSSADSARLHIKDGVTKSSKPFIDSGTWRNMVQSEREKFYTLDSDHDFFFTKGDTSGVDPTEHPSFFQYMKERFTDCFKITSVDRFEVIPHWEVWGK